MYDLRVDISGSLKSTTGYFVGYRPCKGKNKRLSEMGSLKNVQSEKLR